MPGFLQSVNVNEREYKTMRFDPNYNSPEYVGLHEDDNAAEASEGYKIYKISSTLIQVSYGAWNNRLSLF
jgi:hypothetical protein